MSKSRPIISTTAASFFTFWGGIIRKKNVAWLIVVAMFALTSGGCNGSSSSVDSPSGDFNAVMLNKEAVYDEIRPTMEEADVDTTKGRILSAWAVSFLNSADLNGKELKLGDLVLTFEEVNHLTKSFTAVDVLATNLTHGNYYQLLFKNIDTSEGWLDRDGDSVTTFDDTFAFSLSLPSGTGGMEIALLELDADGFELPETIENKSEATQIRMTTVAADKGLSPLPIYVALDKDATDADFDIEAIRYAELLKKLADADAQWTESDVAKHLQDAHAWSQRFLLALEDATADAAATKRVVEFLRNVDKWDILGDGHGIPDVMYFASITGIAFKDIVAIVEGGVWDSVAGSRGFFEACKARRISFVSVLEDYILWCGERAAEWSKDDPAAFSRYLDELFSVPQKRAASKAGSGVGDAIDILKTGWDIIGGTAPKILTELSGTRVLLRGDMEPMNFQGATRMTKAIHWQTMGGEPCFDIMLILDYSAKYTGTEVTKWKGKGYFIPSYYVRLDSKKGWFAHTTRLSTVCESHVMNIAPIESDYAEPHVEMRLNVTDTIFGFITTIDQRWRYTINGRSGITMNGNWWENN